MAKTVRKWLYKGDRVCSQGELKKGGRTKTWFLSNIIYFSASNIYLPLSAFYVLFFVPEGRSGIIYCA